MNDPLSISDSPSDPNDPLHIPVVQRWLAEGASPQSFNALCSRYPHYRAWFTAQVRQMETEQLPSADGGDELAWALRLHPYPGLFDAGLVAAGYNPAQAPTLLGILPLDWWRWNQGLLDSKSVSPAWVTSLAQLLGVEKSAVLLIESQLDLHPQVKVVAPDGLC